MTGSTEAPEFPAYLDLVGEIAARLPAARTALEPINEPIGACDAPETARGPRGAARHGAQGRAGADAGRVGRLRQPDPGARRFRPRLGGAVRAGPLHLPLLRALSVHASGRGLDGRAALSHADRRALARLAGLVRRDDARDARAHRRRRSAIAGRARGRARRDREGHEGLFRRRSRPSVHRRLSRRRRRLGEAPWPRRRSACCWASSARCARTRAISALGAPIARAISGTCARAPRRSASRGRSGACSTAWA